MRAEAPLAGHKGAHAPVHRGHSTERFLMTKTQHQTPTSHQHILPALLNQYLPFSFPLLHSVPCRMRSREAGPPCLLRTGVGPQIPQRGALPTTPEISAMPETRHSDQLSSLHSLFGEPLKWTECERHTAPVWLPSIPRPAPMLPGFEVCHPGSGSSFCP